MPSTDYIQNWKNSIVKMSGLEGKVVLITGASSGIGEGTAIHFAKLGDELIKFPLSARHANKVIRNN